MLEVRGLNPGHSASKKYHFFSPKLKGSLRSRAHPRISELSVRGWGQAEKKPFTLMLKQKEGSRSLSYSLLHSIMTFSVRKPANAVWSHSLPAAHTSPPLYSWFDFSGSFAPTSDPKGGLLVEATAMLWMGIKHTPLWVLWLEFRLQSWYWITLGL